MNKRYLAKLSDNFWPVCCEVQHTYGSTEREPTHSIVVVWVTNFQSELMIKIYSKSLVRATGKVLLIKWS